MINGSRILVVEDNEELQGILADFLEVKGAEADFASNGLQGLNLALEHDFDAIVLDVMMPKLDGMDVLREIKKDSRMAVIPIVILTSSEDTESLRQSYLLQANSYIHKPVDFDEFVCVIDMIGHYWLNLNLPPPTEG